MEKETYPPAVCGIPWRDFERETMRVASYTFYPRTAVKPANLLADNGFVYIGDGKNDKVICYFCHARKEKWKSNEDIEEVHRSLCPDCPMVAALQTVTVTTASAAEYSGSLSNGTTAAVSRQYSRTGSTPSVVTSPLSLSSSSSSVSLSAVGQVVTSPNNSTQSSENTAIAQTRTAVVYPQIRQSNMTAGCHREHRQVATTQTSGTQSYQTHSTHRAGIMPKFSATTATKISRTVGHSTQIPHKITPADLAIITEKAKYPQYAILSNRLETFYDWPQDSPMNPEDLAKAGLFHRPIGQYRDRCCCFFCGQILRQWEPMDDPFVEHARWFPECGYIQEYMGKDFVQAVQELVTRNEKVTHTLVLEYMLKHKMSLESVFEDISIEDDAAVKSLLVGGYNKEHVIEVAKEMKKKGIALSVDTILENLGEPVHEMYKTSHVNSETTQAHSEDALQELKEGNETLRSSLMCKICMDKEVRVVFLPCGHLVCCQECATALNSCPICRKTIKGIVRAMTI